MAEQGQPNDTGESTFTTKTDFTETPGFNGTNTTQPNDNNGNVNNTNQTNQADKEEDPVWKKTMKTYTQNFTLHGLTRAMHGQLWERIFWGIVLSILTVLIMIHVSGQMSKYLEYSIYTNFEIRYKGEVTFPSVTICDKGIIYQPMRACGIEIDDSAYQDVPLCTNEYRMMNTNGSVGHINSDGVFEHPLFKINVETYDKHSEKVKMNHYESLGLYKHRCVTWNPAGNVTKGKYGLAVLSLQVLDPHVMPFVTAHGPGEYFELSQGVTASPVIPGFIQRLNIKATHYERLPKPYPSQCRDVRMPESSSAVSEYSRKLCIDLRIPVTELENCGSVDDYFYPFISESLIEKYGKAQTIGQFNQCRKDLRQTGAQTNKLRECDPPCRQTQVKTNIENIGENQAAPHEASLMIKLVNSDTVDYVVEKKLYEWNIMMADMGGLIGLLNGSSICSAFEIVIAVGLFLFGKKHMAELYYHQHLEQHLHLHGHHHHRPTGETTT